MLALENSVSGGMGALIPPIPGGMVNLRIWEGGMVKGGMGGMVDLGGGYDRWDGYEGSEAAVGGQKKIEI